MNHLFFLRHGDVDPEPHKPHSTWALSSLGRSKVHKLVEKGIFRDIGLIYSSEENKAYCTAQIIAETVGKKVQQMSNFNELNRTGFSKNYDRAVKEAFANLSQSIRGWEPCTVALQRFRAGVEKLNQRHKNSKILIVSHGIVLALYFAHVKRQMDDLFSRWKKADFLSYGVMEGSKVIRDITEQNNRSDS